MRDLYSNVSSVLNPASPFAGDIDWLFRLTIWISGAIVLLVAGFVTFNIVRYRDRGDREGEPPQIHGNTAVELTWTIGPFLLLAVIFWLSMGVMARISPAPGKDGPEVDMTVVGHQWWWEVRYDGTDAVTANELHIPVGRPVRLHLESADVIHSFWVPRLGPKQDLIPGHPNTLVLQANEPGTYLGTCAEYCGDEHAWMRIRVVASDEATFQAWLAHEAEPKREPATALAKRGETLFRQKTCASCHTIRGLPERPLENVGPDLTHVADRTTLAAGILPNTPGNMLRWLFDAQTVKPGTYMPTYRLGPNELAALVAYLDGTPPPSAEANGQPRSVDGAKIYQQCAACHQADGKGVEGSFPPLAGHLPALYRAARDLPPKIVLFGLQGEIHVDGTRYNGAMPTWGALLSDAEVAAVLNHELTSWGNRKDLPADFEPYSPQDIAAVRTQQLTPHQVLEARNQAGLQ